MVLFIFVKKVRFASHWIAGWHLVAAQHQVLHLTSTSTSANHQSFNSITQSLKNHCLFATVKMLAYLVYWPRLLGWMNSRLTTLTVPAYLFQFSDLFFTHHSLRHTVPLLQNLNQVCFQRTVPTTFPPKRNVRIWLDFGWKQSESQKGDFGQHRF